MIEEYMPPVDDAKEEVREYYDNMQQKVEGVKLHFRIILQQRYGSIIDSLKLAKEKIEEYLEILREHEKEM